MFGSISWEGALILVVLFGAQSYAFRHYVRRAVRKLQRRVAHLETKLEYLERHNDLLVAAKVDVRKTIDG